MKKGAYFSYMAETGLENQTIHLRVSGCPNGCARPYLGEIAITGRALGKYNLFLGADTGGQRLEPSLQGKYRRGGKSWTACGHCLSSLPGNREREKALATFCTARRS